MLLSKEAQIHTDAADILAVSDSFLAALDMVGKLKAGAVEFGGTPVYVLNGLQYWQAVEREMVNIARKSGCLFAHLSA